MSKLLDQYGRPIEREPARYDLNAVAKAMARVQGSYDAARTSDGLANYWQHADRFDADSANSKGVRHTLISRSRYEIANNGYADGIAHTYATDLVGVGPSLRMQTTSKPFNQMVERNWYLWSKAVQLRRKLWCMAHAKHVDGEAFAVIRINPRVKFPVPIDLKLYEAEQCQNPYERYDDPNECDGVHFDDFDNPIAYDFLRYHPGSGEMRIDLEPVTFPAEQVLHWFKLRRPGQHRGVVEMASTLNLGAAFRRLREANLATAEKIAAWTLFLKTMFDPGEEESEGVVAMTTQEIVHGMMTALPNTVEPFQLKAEHPGPTYDTFHKTLLNEQGRPKSMPYNKTACDSSQYNYASGRLDHQTYHGHLDVDREDGNDQVLDPTFDLWLDLSIRRFGWLGGDPEAVGPGARFHTWDWPKHRVADVESEANANDTKLKSGQAFLHQLFSDAGYDFEDELEKAAESFGVEIDELRTRLLDVIFPPPKQLDQAQPKEEPGEAVAAFLHRANGFAKPAANGVHHGN